MDKGAPRRLSKWIAVANAKDDLVLEGAQKAVDDDSMDQKALIRLGLIYFERKDYEKAGEFLYKAQAINKSSEHCGWMFWRALGFSQYRSWVAGGEIANLE